MRSLVRVTIVSGLLAGAWPATVHAQPALDRVVGGDFFGKPLVVTSVTSSSIGALSGAAQVPMGFEAALQAGPAGLTIEATGRPLRAVLDAIVAADPRYEWRDESGVIVLRPAAAWLDRENALHRSIAPMHYDHIGAGEAMRIVAALFGNDLPASQRDDLGDPKRFALDLPGGTVLDALNGIVRAHGALAWGLEPSTPPTHIAPGTYLSSFQVTLVRPAGGRGHGVGVDLQLPIAVPDDLEPPPLSRPESTPVLDRSVGPGASTLPVMLRGVMDVPELAAAARAPMGVELLPLTQPRVLKTGDGTNVTGMALRDALTVLVTVDPRYEWREIDGVVVVRPASVWTDMAHPLLRDVGAVHRTRTTLQDAVAFVQAVVDPERRYVPLSNPADSALRRFSIDVPAGTLLTLANATVRAHGAACWIYEELDDRDTAFYAGRSHQLSMQARGTGMGFAFR